MPPASSATRLARWWRSFPRNARILIATEPAWSVFGAYWGLYMPLYLTHLHASAALIGWIAAWSYALQTACSLLGGLLAQRVARIRVVTVFDFFAWVLPFALWLALPNLWVAVAAQLATVSSALVVPAWNALFLEDAPPAQRPQLMNLLQLTIFGPAVCLPLLAGLIRAHGLMAVTRGVFASSLVLVSAAWLTRALTVRDSPFARGLLQQRARLPEVLAAYRRVLSAMGRPAALAVFALQLVGIARTILWTTYLPLFLVDRAGLRLPGSTIVLLPAVGAVALVLTGLVAMPHLQRDHPVAALGLGQAGACAAAVLLAAAAPDRWWEVLAAWVLGNAASAATFPTLGGMWYNLFPRTDFTALQAVTGSLGTLAAIPLGPLAGALYALHPRLPFWGSAALQGGGLVLAVALWWRPPRAPEGEFAPAPHRRAPSGTAA